ncbi:MAG: formyltetrahydrofolate deformylase [Pseudomonadales bacterium]|nr:formyltetrahydrofolate deformylase [Pseudomonadales bacterium]
MTTNPKTEYILTYQCPDQLGVVSKVASILFASNAFITEISQYSDADSKTFFSRIVFDDRAMLNQFDGFETTLAELAIALQMKYSLRLMNKKPKILLAVSKFDHCLNVMLTKWQANALDVEIVGVVSNHDHCRAVVEFYGLPYYFLPVTKDTRPNQEAAILQLINQYQVDLLVLARYMQILSDNFCNKLETQIINIHHSFLPGFKGAKPYHQAYDRGVKIIGATAHYVTSDLDEGPIIVQEVKAIDHRVTANQMVHIGHDLEATALAHAVKLHCEDRVMTNGMRTVIL